MSTIREIIERVDENKPNAFQETTKLAWIAALDGKIALNVMLMDIAETAHLRYPHPEGMDMEPLVKFPHDDLYDLWLGAKIDAENGETDKYQNSMQMYNAAYRDYVRWFASTYAPAQDESNAITYYITAYGLAVQQGFSGGIEEWLASLKGEKGDTGKSAYEYAREGGYEGTEEEFKQFVGTGVQSDTSLTIPGGLADAKVTGEEIQKAKDAAKKAADDSLPKAGGKMTGTLNMGGNGISNLADPVNDADAVNRKYLKEQIKDFIPKAGGTMTGTLNMGGNGISNLANPVNGTDAVNKGYVDTKAVPVALIASGWSDAAPYTQTVQIEGLSNELRARVYPVWPEDAEEELALKEETAKVGSFRREGSALTVRCLEEKPVRDIPIVVEVYR